MGDGTRENPYTREDVLRLIKENGDKAEGLDLSGKVFEESVDLHEVSLNGITLTNAFLRLANLEMVDLGRANLKDAFLSSTNLRRAFLWNANLEGAFLWDANLEGAFLWNAKLSSDTKLEDVNWGNYILAEEKEFAFDMAVEIYRQLKIWYTHAGCYDIAGEFFFREMTARRKALRWWPNPYTRIWSKFVSVLCGYGEKWHRVIISAITIVFALALVYFAFGTLTPDTFLNSLYYSAVSFTALGYGSWAAQPTGWVKWLGAFEAFIGVFMMALFLVTFTRKMTR